MSRRSDNSEEKISRNQALGEVLSRAGLSDITFDELQKACPKAKVLFASSGMQVVHMAVSDVVAMTNGEVPVADGDIYLAYVHKGGFSNAVRISTFLASSIKDLVGRLHREIYNARSPYELGAMLGFSPSSRTHVVEMETRKELLTWYESRSLYTAAAAVVMRAIEGWAPGINNPVEQMLRFKSGKEDGGSATCRTLFGDVAVQDVTTSPQRYLHVPVSAMQVDDRKVGGCVNYRVDFPMLVDRHKGEWVIRSCSTRDRRVALEINTTGRAMALWQYIKDGLEMFHWAVGQDAFNDLERTPLFVSGISEALRGAGALAGDVMSVWEASGRAQEIVKRNETWRYEPNTASAPTAGAMP